MKTLRLTIILLSFFCIRNFSQAQTIYWQGGSHGNFSDMANWSSGTTPSINDTIIFDIGTPLTVTDIPPSMMLGGMKILNFTEVTFASSQDVFPIINYIEIEENSSFNIVQLDYDIEIQCDIAFIGGEIYLDGPSHKLLPMSPSSLLLFQGTSIFTAGTNFDDYPFGSLDPGTVEFMDGSSYYHYGGMSPFGSESISVTKFDPESNYYIMEGDGSNIYFSEKTYGNIINDSGNDIIIEPTGTGIFPFSFNTMTSVNGAITFNGDDLDQIEIYGNLIDAQAGVISLKSGLFTFTNSDTYIEGNHDVMFYIDFSIGAAFSMLNAGDSLTLNNNLDIISSDGTSHNVSVLGTLDCTDKNITLNDVYLHLLDPAIFITSHPNGFSGNINNNVSYMPGTTFKYNGNTTQGTGFATNYTGPIGTMVIENPNGVEMDYNLNVRYLELYDDLLIDVFKLKILNLINYFGGKLIGEHSSSKLEVASLLMGDFLINTNLYLDSLIINTGANTTVKLEDAGSLFVNNFKQEKGIFYINDGTLDISKSFDYVNGEFVGGANAGLIFNSTVDFINPYVNSLELGTLESYTNFRIILQNDLSVYNLLRLSDGELDFSDHALNLYGDVICEGGTLGASGLSSLFIDESGIVSAIQSNLVFNQVEADNRRTLNSFSLNKINILNIDGNLDISDNITISGKIRVQEGTIDITNATTTLSGNSYFITGENGTISSNVAVGNSFNFPIGTIGTYAPVLINPLAADEFVVSVKDSVYANGTYGETLHVDSLVNLTWDVQTSSNNYNLSLNWETAVQGIFFNPVDASVFHYSESDLIWENISISNVGTAGNISVDVIGNSGFFTVSSQMDINPVEYNGEVATPLGVDYTFLGTDFLFEFDKLKITENLTNGVLYLDNDDNGTLDTGEELFIDSEVYYSDIIAGKFKYQTLSQGSFLFSYIVSFDGTIYGTDIFNMTIIVGTGDAPLVVDQSFTIPEHSVDGFEFGPIEVATAEAGRTIVFEMLNHDNSDAFDISDDGYITVTNSNLLEFSLNPQFKYPMKVYYSDNSLDYTEFLLSIFLTERIVGNLSPTNYISPNGDGVNDTWLLLNRKFENQYNVVIFDKNGSLVYRSENYQNDWDGTRNGNKLNPGVYYYLVRSGTVEEKGTITLVR